LSELQESPDTEAGLFCHGDEYKKWTLQILQPENRGRLGIERGHEI
jgi:hypothetical protein